VTRRRAELLDSQFEPPAGSLETAVARIAADVLGVDQIGRSDSFFDFDATSMNVLQICARIETEIGYQIPPHLIFENDVLADLASWVELAAARPQTGLG
jgi:acyl carrier protein